MRRGAAGVAGFATSLALLAGGTAASRCGSSPPSNPTPTPPSQSAAPSPPGPTTFTLSGVVTDSTTRGPVPGATVAITTGPNADKNATADANGAYSIAALTAGSFIVHTSARGYVAADRNVTLSATARLDVTLDREAATAALAPACNAALWAHLYDPKRLTVRAPCMTVTGVIANQHNSDDATSICVSSPTLHS